MPPMLVEGREAFNTELKRKAFHQLILIYLAAFFILGRTMMLRWMIFWVTFVFTMEVLRLRAASVERFVSRIFSKIMRAKEYGRLSGMFYASLGVLGTVFFCGNSPRIVVASILYLTFGDAASCLVGMGAGRHVYIIWGMKRTIEGVAAGFVVALVIGVAAGFSLVAAGGAAVVFSVVDALPLPPDDNLWIPLASATALRLLN